MREYLSCRPRTGIFGLCLLSVLFLDSPGAIADGGEVEFGGLITSIDQTAQTLTVNQQVVAVDSFTLIEGNSGEALTFADLAFGMSVEVHGIRLPDGTVRADRIEIEDSVSGDRDSGTIKFTGLVEAVDADMRSLLVNGLLIVTTAFTEFEGFGADPFGAGGLMPDQVVEVKGTPLPDGSILAGELELEDDLAGDNIDFTIKFRGFIESIDPGGASMVISGREVLTDASTRFEGEDDLNLTFADFSVGQLVEVKGNSLADGSILAVEIELEDDDSDGGIEVEFKGLIESIDPAAQSMTVAGRLVATDAMTRFEGDDDAILTFADFSVGQFVEVEGDLQPDGSVLAKKIELEDDDDDDEVEVEVEFKGLIESIDLAAASMVVDGRLVQTDAATRFEGDDDAPLAISDFSVGQFVEVEGRLQADGSILAKEVELEDSDHDDENEFEFTGHVQSIDAASLSIVVEGLAVLTDASTEFEGDGQPFSSFADLQVGQFVEVDGHLQDDGSIVAKKIELEGEGEDEFEFKGVIQSIDAGAPSMVVSGLTVHIDAATRLEGDHGAPLALSDFIVGQRVKVRGDLQSDGSILAERIRLDDDDDFEVEFKGLIESIDPGASSMVIGGRQVATNAFTRFEGEDDASLVFGDFSVGQFVEVEGILQSDGSILAKKIELEDDEHEDDFELEFKGLIDSIDAASLSLVVGGLPVLTDAQTRFEGEDDSPLGFEDLRVGQVVEVEGILQADGSVLARKIELEDDEPDDEIELEFKGLIESINAVNASMVVGGILVHTNEFTRFEGDDHILLTFADFSVGQRVEVEGVLQPDGSLLASKIELEDDHDGDGVEVEFKGLIESIDAANNSMVVAGRQVLTDEFTRFEGDDHLPLTFADFSAGQRVEVEGILQPDGSVLAFKVELEDNLDDDEIEAEFKGLIESIDAANGAMVVAGRQVLTDAFTRFEGDDHLPLAFEDFGVGQFVEVEGVLQPDGSVLASKIELEDGPDEDDAEVELEGFIESIDPAAASLVVDGVEILTDDFTRFEADGHLPLTFADLEVGQFVKIKGILQGDGTILATKVKRKLGPGVGVHIEFKGFIEFINSSFLWMMVSGRAVQVTLDTRLLDEFNTPIAFGDLAIGQFVEVEGTNQPDETVVATKIKLEDRDDIDDRPGFRVKLRGGIDELDPDNGTMTVLNFTILMDADTRLRDEHNLPIAFTDFAVGQIVKVKGRLQPDGTILAAKIEIKDDPPPEGSNNVQVLGTINSIDLVGDSFMVNGVLVSIDDGTFFEDLFGVGLTLEDLRIGDFVNVTGDLQADGSVRSTSTSMVDPFFALPQAPDNEVSGGIWTLY